MIIYSKKRIFGYYRCRQHTKFQTNTTNKHKQIMAETDPQNVDQLEPTYMYSQLFKEFILDIDEDDTKSLNNLVSYCRSKSISETELQNFQREYHQKSPIWWYTSSTSLRNMLDQALQSLDMETMTKMAFFIRSLHRQLEQLYNEQSSTHMKPFI
ncbi:unnamed protein product, partial [Rotaria sordida]